MWVIGSADVVAGVLQIGLGQGHEEAVHPVDPLGPQLAVPRHFRPEEHLHVFFFQAERIGEGGHDDRLQQALDQLVAAQRDAVLVQDLAADVVVDLRLEVVLGDHQVGRAAADVDAGDADFVGLVAERLRLALLALAPGRRAAGRRAGRRPAGRWRAGAAATSGMSSTLGFLRPRSWCMVVNQSRGSWPSIRSSLQM